MNTRQAFGLTLFLVSCLAFGYFSVQKVGAALPLTIGSGMIALGAFAHLQQKPATRKPTNKTVN
jgi:hypothetical protein